MDTGLLLALLVLLAFALAKRLPAMRLGRLPLVTPSTARQGDVQIHGEFSVSGVPSREPVWRLYQVQRWVSTPRKRPGGGRDYTHGFWLTRFAFRTETAVVIRDDAASVGVDMSHVELLIDAETMLDMDYTLSNLESLAAGQEPLRVPYDPPVPERRHRWFGRLVLAVLGVLLSYYMTGTLLGLVYLSPVLIGTLWFLLWAGRATTRALATDLAKPWENAELPISQWPGRWRIRRYTLECGALVTAAGRAEHDPVKGLRLMPAGRKDRHRIRLAYGRPDEDTNAGRRRWWAAQPDPSR